MANDVNFITEKCGEGSFGPMKKPHGIGLPSISKDPLMVTPRKQQIGPVKFQAIHYAPLGFPNSIHVVYDGDWFSAVVKPTA